MGEEEETTVKKMGPLQKCTLEHFPNKYHQDYAKNNFVINNYLCLSLNYKIDLINNETKKILRTYFRN